MPKSSSSTQQQQQLPSISSLLQVKSNKGDRQVDHNFTVPTQSVITKAIGEPLPAMFLPGNSFDPLPPPGPDDWLNQYLEEGQTFQSFLDADLDEPYVGIVNVEMYN